MIRHVWSVLCQSSSIDNETNHISLFDVLDSLTIYGNPKEEITIPLKVDVVCLWVRADEETPCRGTMRLSYLKPAGKSFDPIEAEINLIDVMFFRNRLHVEMLSLAGPGIYKFCVELKDEVDDSWNKVAELPFIVKYENRREAGQ